MLTFLLHVPMYQYADAFSKKGKGYSENLN